MGATSKQKWPGLAEEFSAIADKALTSFRHALERGEKIALQAILINSASNEMTVVQMDSASSEAKAASAAHVRQVAMLLDIDCVIVAVEAWGLPAMEVKNAERIMEQYGSISNYPGRVDTLSVMVETHDGIWQANAPIKFKAPSKKKRTIGEVEFLRPTAAAGRLSNFLMSRGPTH